MPAGGWEHSTVHQVVTSRRSIRRQPDFSTWNVWWLQGGYATPSFYCLSICIKLSLSLSIDCHNPLIQNCTSNIHCFWGFSNRFLTLLTWVLRPCAFRGRISFFLAEHSNHKDIRIHYKLTNTQTNPQRANQASNEAIVERSKELHTNGQPIEKTTYTKQQNSQRMPETKRFHEIRINQQTFAAWWSQTCILPSSFGLTIHFHPLASFGVWTARA